MKTEYDVIVVGGGAAGFFTALNIKESNPNTEVLILERTKEVLSKVKVSGGGRCNVTHAEFIPSELVTNYPRGAKELLGPFHKFMTGDTMSWFEKHGIELKIEDDGRIFPVSDSSQTIIDCFLKLAKRLIKPAHYTVSLHLFYQSTEQLHTHHLKHQTFDSHLMMFHHYKATALIFFGLEFQVNHDQVY